MTRNKIKWYKNLNISKIMGGQGRGNTSPRQTTQRELQKGEVAKSEGAKRI